MFVTERKIVLNEFLTVCVCVCERVFDREKRDACPCSLCYHSFCRSHQLDKISFLCIVCIFLCLNINEIKTDFFITFFFCCCVVVCSISWNIVSGPRKHRTISICFVYAFAWNSAATQFVTFISIFFQP